MKFDELSNKVIGCALEVHKAIGAGLLESAYESCFTRELELAAIPFRRQMSVPVKYKGMSLDCGYRMDLLVDNQIIVELKSVEEILGIHEAQLLTYMKLAKIPIGLLINFKVALLKNGIRRFVL